jgi:hypothetical protein
MQKKNAPEGAKGLVRPNFSSSGCLSVLLSRLHKVQRTGADRWKACCPAHDDKSPSLAIRDVDGRLLLHCFGGCSTEDVLSAVGLTFSDLMPERALGNHKPRERKPFYAGDVLKIMAFEAGIVYLCAADIANDKPPTESGRERLLLAASRLNHACEVANNGY